jgi:glycosyltransferase involved in cell wall biosynthesis
MARIKMDSSKKGDKNKRIALFAVIPGVESSPSIVNLVESLAEEGYIVDFFLPYSFEKALGHSYKNIHFYPGKGLRANGKPKITKQILNFSLIGRFLSGLYRSTKLHGAKAGILYAIFIARHLAFLSHVYSVIKGRKYICFIGVEKEGLVSADLVNYNEVPLIYYSLELYYSARPGIVSGLRFNIIKELEVMAHHDAMATIIQDEERAKVLFEYNRVSRDKQKTLYLPVSMLGEAFRERTDFFNRRLGIPGDKKILLQLGMIASARMSLEIAKSAQDWPEDWALVMHGKFYEDAEHQLRELNKKGNIFVSERKVPLNDMPKVVASAHIGLVFYKNFKQDYYNNYYIGSSSGQLAHHLQCGIPIITINIPSLSRIVDEYQCGLAVDDVNSIPEAASIIFSKYESYRENAFRCFAARYRFDKYFRNISQFIKSLA